MTSSSCIVTVYAFYYFNIFNWYVIKTLLREMLYPYVSERKASVSCLLTIGKASLFLIFTYRFNLVTYANKIG